MNVLFPKPKNECLSGFQSLFFVLLSSGLLYFQTMFCKFVCLTMAVYVIHHLWNYIVYISVVSGVPLALLSWDNKACHEIPHLDSDVMLKKWYKLLVPTHNHLRKHIAQWFLNPRLSPGWNSFECFGQFIFKCDIQTCVPNIVIMMSVIFQIAELHVSSQRCLAIICTKQ